MKRQYTDEELLTALRENPDLSVKEWIRRSIIPTYGTILRRFGSWNEARRRASLPILKRRKWTKEKIIESLKNLAEELGRSPVVKDDPALYQASRLHFGGWNKAKGVAGLETYPSKVSEGRMLEEA